MDAYGTVDELNSFIGLLIEDVIDADDVVVLKNIQSLLFVIGCELATEHGRESFHKLQASDIDMLEKEIDRIDSALPKLSGFIMPGGSRSAAVSHVCRTVCRRAERFINRVNEEETVDDLILIFINRLSDYLFVLARKLCLAEKQEEIIWHNTCR